MERCSSTDPANGGIRRELALSEHEAMASGKPRPAVAATEGRGRASDQPLRECKREPLSLLGLYTGARKEAICRCAGRRLTLPADGLISTPQAPGGKKGSGARRVPIPAKLLGHLRRASVRGVELGFVINENGKRLG